MSAAASSLNEPCTCTGTFNATVAVRREERHGTSRYCIALHIPAGQRHTRRRLHPQTSTRTAAALARCRPAMHTMFGFFPNFPCNTGGDTVCVGPFDSSGNPTVVRGKCAANTCATLAWTTSPNAAGCTTADQSPPGGQCRHQGICIIGFGVSLDCDTSEDEVQTSCAVDCGASATLRATVDRRHRAVSPTASERAPALAVTSRRWSATRPSGLRMPRSHDFTVTPTETTTYTVMVQDGHWLAAALRRRP